MNITSGFQPFKQGLDISPPHPRGMGLKYIGLSALVNHSGVYSFKCLLTEQLLDH